MTRLRVVMRYSRCRVPNPDAGNQNILQPATCDRDQPRSCLTKHRPTMDPLHSCIALGPLAVYLSLIGMINLSRRPFLTNGGRDAAALGIGISGFLIAGPMELFLPEAAAAMFGGFVWLLLIGLYVMAVVLVVLVSRPKLVIYNLRRKQLRPLLEELAPQLDHQARWAGDSLLLPTLGVNLTMEWYGVMRNVQIVSAGPHQDFGGWRRLEDAISTALKDTPTMPNPAGISQLASATAIVVILARMLIDGQLDVAQALWDMLRL